MTGRVPTSLAGVTHYGDLEANFNQGDPNVRHLTRLLLARTSTMDAPVYVAYRNYASASFNRGCPNVCRFEMLIVGG
ncbi:hypothetical protein CDL15_Pgr029211 [Punica granatum]|uniref:Uncharacterized protein n=1 Tax=Punica granatum TaxID=22663 RepID=A0A218XDP0_PUNGR|nr:hypothetical protein CDL15_Pgr029211 [Punica granatum]